MKNDNIKKLKEEFYEEEIMGLMNANNGYITSKQITSLGIHRMYLNNLILKKKIERIERGIYIEFSKIEDIYYVFSISIPSAIFSHMTALYFHGISIKAPDERWDITVKKEYHNSKLAKHNIFYVDKKIYELGLMEIDTVQGNKVKVYDVERCICDIIRSKRRMDMEHIKNAIKEYLKRKDKNITKLSEYACKLGIKEEVMDLVSLMYE